MAALSKLSGPKLQALIVERNRAWGLALDATIASGMGHMRGSEIHTLAQEGDTLLHRVRVAREYVTTRALWLEAMDELDARRAYHGSDKPIKKKEAY